MAIPGVPSSTAIGTRAEDFAADWLIEQGWIVLHRRWRCRGGELDLIAQQPQPAVLVFIEVKARSRGSWDADGLLAITPQKQAKLWRSAQLFLAAHPHLAELPCRFDVALVQCAAIAPPPKRRAAAEPIAPPTYRFTLQRYLPGAFESID